VTGMYIVLFFLSCSVSVSSLPSPHLPFPSNQGEDLPLPAYVPFILEYSLATRSASLALGQAELGTQPAGRERDGGYRGRVPPYIGHSRASCPIFPPTCPLVTSPLPHQI